MAAEPGKSNGYEQLRQRAVLFIREQGGAVLEERVIDHVFGSSGKVALWRPLLRQVLQDDERVVLRSDGYWALRSAAPAADELPQNYVVLDVETTGLKPSRQRMIEVAAIRYRDGARQEIFSTLLNPERRVPAYVSRLTSIDDAQLLAAPPFRHMADQLLRFLEDDLLVGYNIKFDIAFINAELKRLGRPPLINEHLDLLPLAAQLLPTVRKGGLDGLCRALDLSVRERHRAEPDADVTALVFARLIGAARAQGLTALESLQRAAAAEVPVPRRRGPIGRGRAVLDRDHLADIPTAPGVYLMRDARDRVIYVGKAKHLRNRVASYYSQPLGYTRKMDGLLESIARIEVVQTGSELEALLLEAQFIRRYQPAFNTQQRNTGSYPYIKIDVGNPWPRVTLTRQRADDGAHYVGPFRTSRAVRLAVELIHDVFHLRTCNRSFRTARSYGSPCLQLELGRCPGPCVGRADRDRYRETVLDVIGFLHGEREEAIGLLHQRLADAAERLDFEGAARLRDQIRRVQQLVLSQQLLDETVERGYVLIVTPSPVAGARELLMVVQGRLWAQIQALPEDSDTDVGRRLERSWQRATLSADFQVDQDSLDQVHILGRWLRKYAGHPAILPLRPEPRVWLDLAAAARAVPETALTFDQGLGPATDDDVAEIATGEEPVLA